MNRKGKAVLWAVAAAVAAAVGIAVYWLNVGRITDAYSNDVGSVLVSANGSTISVPLRDHLTGSCHDNITSDLQVSESAQSVRLRVHTRKVAGGGACISGTYALEPQTLSVTLAEPLGNRALLDWSGKPLAYFDENTLLKPRPLSTDAHFVAIYPGTPMIAMSLGAADPVVTQEFLTTKHQWVYIVAEEGTHWSQPGGHITDTTVHGVPAHLYTAYGYTTLEWIERGQVVELIAQQMARPSTTADELASWAAVLR